MGVSEARRIARARRAARKLLTQALYQLQLAGQPWQDIANQFHVDPEYAGADAEFFGAALRCIAEERASLDEALARSADIAPAQMDPTEHGILWLALYELKHRPDVPFRVVISEAVELAKRFGATEGHRFVNGVLDRAARELRGAEYGRGG
jgi:transcription antitermination protein NusB